MSEDEEEYCGGCDDKIYVCNKLCYIFQCCKYACIRCTCCKEHSKLSKLKEDMVIVRKEYERKIKMKEVNFFFYFYENSMRSLSEIIRSMEVEIENDFKILQQVHNKQLPDDISRMITSYLY